MAFFRRKLLSAALLLIGLSLVSFGALKFLPGDPAQVIAGDFADEATVDLVRKEMKLDRSFVVQYADYVGGAVRGDLGVSYQNRQPVRSLMARPLWLSLKLMVFAQTLALGIAIPLGLWLAYRKGSRLDRMVNGVAFALISVPGFVSGIVLALLFGYRFRIFPTIYPTDATTIDRQLRALFLPAAAIALSQAPVYMRLLRSDTIATLQEDFITAARTRGLSPRQILFRHAFRPSSFSLLTLAGVNVGHLIGGAVIIERVFAIPGLGTTLITAVSQRDYLVAVGIILTIGAGFIVVNLIIDLLYGVIDPRVRRAR
jgi:peptide/nickel transport system permease protein